MLPTPPIPPPIYGLHGLIAIHTLDHVARVRHIRGNAPRGGDSIFSAAGKTRARARQAPQRAGEDMCGSTRRGTAASVVVTDGWQCAKRAGQGGMAKVAAKQQRQYGAQKRTLMRRTMRAAEVLRRAFMPRQRYAARKTDGSPAATPSLTRSAVHRDGVLPRPRRPEYATVQVNDIRPAPAHPPPPPSDPCRFICAFLSPQVTSTAPRLIVCQHAEPQTTMLFHYSTSTCRRSFADAARAGCRCFFRRRARLRQITANSMLPGAPCRMMARERGAMRKAKAPCRAKKARGASACARRHT